MARSSYFFGSSNTGYLFLNWPKSGFDHKKIKKVAFLELFLDHQIQVIYSWTGQILVPKMIRWTFDKIVLWVKSELKVANVHCGKQLMYEQRTTHDEHEKLEGLYTIGPIYANYLMWFYILLKSFLAHFSGLPVAMRGCRRIYIFLNSQNRK